MTAEHFDDGRTDVRGRGRRLSAAEVGASLSTQFEAFPEAVGRLREELGPDASAADAIEVFVAGTGQRSVHLGPVVTATNQE